ncbi:hypothetical protein [Phaeobacter sp. JH204B]|uniref:hypothetical protein n=1 Tax=Phaeobacter sp. JH204B TaxID=3112503 RepID=UPI003A88D6B2
MATPKQIRETYAQVESEARRLVPFICEDTVQTCLEETATRTGESLEQVKEVMAAEWSMAGGG